MDSNRTTITHLIVTVGLLFIMEWAARIAARSWNWPEYGLLMLLRILEALVVVSYFATFGPGLKAMGLARERLAAGVKTGLILAACFALAAGSALAGAALLGQNLLPWFRMFFPAGTTDLVIFLVAGCLVGPMTEEIVFRGVLFGFLRPLGQWIAILFSAVLFTLPHLSHGLFPSIQAMVGGVVFAWSYEKSRHLAAPFIIHAAGNAAIFGLGLLQRL